MEAKFKTGDIVYERGSRPRRKMIVKNIYSGMVVCDVFPIFPWEYMVEKWFSEWDLEKA